MNDSGKIGVLLINLGTPETPEVEDVKRYLHEFLLDKRVIDKPWLVRQLLVRGVIVPRRVRSSAESYQQIWTKEGSPLMVYSVRMKAQLQRALGDHYLVELAMRYQKPSIPVILERLRLQNLSKLIIFPLFPQYASATTGSIHQAVMKVVKGWSTIPEIKFINSFYQHPQYIQALVERAQTYDLSQYDHIILSYHGLPRSYLAKADTNKHCLKADNCCQNICQKNLNCYGAHCYGTSKAIAQKLNLTAEQYSITFQSRLGKEPWIEPYTAPTSLELLQQGKKKILIMCPAFVCDCLETIHEIGVELKDEFLQHGGEKLDLVPCLNESETWIKAMASIATEN